LGGQYLNRDLFEMAAAYLFHLVMNHPFVDGNKRVGLMSAMHFLELNGVSIDVPIPTLVDFVIGVTQSVSHKPEIAEFFRTHAVSGK
jgi:death on curing protein